MLSAQHATIWMVVLPPLSRFSTLTVRRPVVALTMVPQTAGPGKASLRKALEKEGITAWYI